MAENNYCLLGYDPVKMDHKGCSLHRCKQCGWNRHVEKYRRIVTRERGLKKGPDGLQRPAWAK